DSLEMRRKVLYIFFLVFIFSGKGVAQTKIYLLPSQGKFGNFTLINASDSIYINIEHSEDMGHMYFQRYSLKSNIPTGKYEVYVNDTINLTGYIKKFKKDSIWTEYYRNGKFRGIKPYKYGKINGEMKMYYNDGTIKYRGLIIDGKAVGITISFNEAGK